VRKAASGWFDPCD